MDCTTKFEDQTLVLALRGKRRKQTVKHLLATGLVLCACHFLVDRSTERICGESIGQLIGIFVILPQQFGTSGLTVSADAVSLHRHTFGPGQTRNFPRPDVERLGYEPEAGQDDAALALMVRTVMMPIRFAMA